MSLDVTPPVSPKLASPIIDARRNSLTSTRRLSNHFTEEPSASSQRHLPRAGAHTDLTASGEKTYHAESHRNIEIGSTTIPSWEPPLTRSLAFKTGTLIALAIYSCVGVSSAITVSGIKIVPFAFKGKTVADGSGNKPHHPRPITCGLIQPMSYRK